MQLPKTSLYNLLNHQTSQPHQHTKHPIDQTPPKTQVHSLQNQDQNHDTTQPPPLPLEKRETYGLLVLELMSANEYEAFQRATAGMSEGDKMLAAQSLYSLTSFYNGKYSAQDIEHSDPYKKNAQKAFGIASQDLNSFLERYKNAYNAVQRVDVTL
ncbi:hypothetical protein BKH46_03865 [Helicobacter sp. 12S02634-8]|uniref:hypothetical protein n=1 Tax=Helicobacter sp. 12S02634-8 TaxID=1476199 RepID=UPI000BCD7CC8|nr:hypothetical protein BKH46_03865 [Helicobacter sp. 12S02634-8]